MTGLYKCQSCSNDDILVWLSANPDRSAATRIDVPKHARCGVSQQYEAERSCSLRLSIACPTLASSTTFALSLGWLKYADGPKPAVLHHGDMVPPAEVPTLPLAAGLLASAVAPTARLLVLGTGGVACARLSPAAGVAEGCCAEPCGSTLSSRNRTGHRAAEPRFRRAASRMACVRVQSVRALAAS